MPTRDCLLRMCVMEMQEADIMQPCIQLLSEKPSNIYQVQLKQVVCNYFDNQLAVWNLSSKNNEKCYTFSGSTV